MNYEEVLLKLTDELAELLDKNNLENKSIIKQYLQYAMVYGNENRFVPILMLNDKGVVLNKFNNIYQAVDYIYKTTKYDSKVAIRMGINKVLNSRRNTSHGYIWKYET